MDASLWYAIQTHSKQEARAAYNLTAWGIETLYPQFKERRVNEWTKIALYTPKPLFPRYLFAKFEVGEMYHKIRFTRGITRIVAFGGIPTPVDQDIIAIIRSRITNDGFVNLYEKINKSDKLLIKEGP